MEEIAALGHATRFVAGAVGVHATCAAQKDLVFAPIHEATEAHWDNAFRTTVKCLFRSPAMVAEQVSMMCYLLSPESGSKTGATYATDGGWTACCRGPQMHRRDVLKALGVAAASAAAAQEAEAASRAFGPYATPRDPAGPAISGRRNVVPIPDDYVMPGIFAGRTVIVAGSARGMGEGANVVGVDIAEGAVSQASRARGRYRAGRAFRRRDSLCGT